MTVTDSAPVPAVSDTPPVSATSGALFEPRVVAVGLVLLLLAGLLGWFLASPPQESYSEVDVGFLADMTDHHQGAIALSFAYLKNESDGLVGHMAREVVTSQSQEIGTMNAFLGEAGNPATIGDGIAMDWMGASVPSDVMPGLATPAEFAELETALGIDADDVFTELMIRHHAAGVAMAEFADAEGDNVRVRRFARGIARVQRTEIAEMNARREQLGLARIEADFTHATDGGH